MFNATISAYLILVCTGMKEADVQRLAIANLWQKHFINMFFTIVIIVAVAGYTTQHTTGRARADDDIIVPIHAVSPLSLLSWRGHWPSWRVAARVTLASTFSSTESDQPKNVFTISPLTPANTNPVIHLSNSRSASIRENRLP